MAESMAAFVRRTASRCAERVAIEWREDGGDRRLTYRELGGEVGRVAGMLRAAGPAPGDLVAILGGNSAEVIVAMLAALDLGCAFVPFDLNFPAARLEEIVAEVRPRFWLVAPHLAGLAGELAGGLGLAMTALPLALGVPARGEWPESPEGAAAAPDSLAYVYFTSGSTGRPKGIAGRLKAIDHFIRWEIETFGIGEGWRVSQLTSPAFDAFLRDAFVPLAAGGTVCVPPDRSTVLDGAGLAAWIDGRRLDLVHCTPSVLRSLLAQPLTPERFPALRHVLLAGEPLLPPDVQRWQDVFGSRIELVNLYGPSETTMIKLFYRVRPGDGTAQAIPIGQPMSGARAIVLDEKGQPCPPGKLGEIYLRTPYRALGYLGRPALTAEVFVRNPLSEREDDIVYRTGDLGRVRADRNFEIVGRRDQQVKIRGVRVEIAPVESALRTHPAVADLAVIDRTDIQGNKILCAYVVLTRPVEAAELGSFLRERLAEAMVPSAFVRMDELPRTLNGKVNRRALPEVGAEGGRVGGEHVAPATPVEEELCRIFGELLRIPRVGAVDNFFDLGGHSLLATLLLTRIRARFGVDVTLGQLFRTPTVRGLALEVARLELAREEEDAEHPEERRAARAEERIAPRPAGRSTVPLSFGQQRLWFVDQLESGSSFFNICAAVRLEGRLAAGVLRRALGEVVRRHEALRTVFVSPSGGPGEQASQRVLPEGSPGIAGLQLADLAALPGERREPEARRLLAAAIGAPLDLARGPLLRAWLMRLEPEAHVMACVVHHIIADWRSLEILVREVTSIYSAWAAGRSSPAAGLPIQYADFALWQREALGERRMAEDLEESLQRLAGAPSFLPLPTDFPRPAVQSFRGAEERTELPEELVAALRSRGREHGCTLFMVVVALYAVQLHALTGESDLVVSAPIGGRDRRETENLIGMFVDTLLLRIRLSGNPGFRELLGRVFEVVTDAYGRRHVPCDRIIRELAPERSLGYSPMLQAGLNVLESDPLEEASLPGLAVRRFDFDPGIAQFELNLVVARSGGRHWAGVQYRTGLFRPATARRLLTQLRALFDLAVQRPGFALREARELLAALEERQLQEELHSRPVSAGPPRRRAAPAGVHPSIVVGQE